MINKEENSGGGDGCIGKNESNESVVEIISVVAPHHGDGTTAKAAINRRPIVDDSEDNFNSRSTNSAIDTDKNDETTTTQQRCNLSYSINHIDKTAGSLPLSQPSHANAPSIDTVTNSHKTTADLSSSQNSVPILSSKEGRRSQQQQQQEQQQHKDSTVPSSSSNNRGSHSTDTRSPPPSTRPTAVTVATDSNLEEQRPSLKGVLPSTDDRESVNQIIKCTSGKGNTVSSSLKTFDVCLDAGVRIQKPLSKDRSNLPLVAVKSNFVKSMHPAISTKTIILPPKTTTTPRCTDKSLCTTPLPPGPRNQPSKVDRATTKLSYVPPSLSSSSVGTPMMVHQSSLQPKEKVTGSSALMSSSKDIDPIIPIASQEEISSSSSSKLTLPQQSPILQPPITTSMGGRSPALIIQQTHTHELLTTSQQPQEPSSQEPQTTGITEITETISPLVAKYGPFALATDTTVESALLRLRTALEQTRLLRAAFTHRVYEKYRVVLRPVPSHIQSVIYEIQAQPKAVYRRYLHQMDMIKTEKEAEKKEAQRLNQDLATSNGVGETAPFLGGLTGVENADQLSWFNAGLGLVILPEEEVDEGELEARGIRFRGPINPGTGMRVGGISQAAAAAACVMLDRVRKGNELRVERKRKQLPGGADTALEVEAKKVCIANFGVRAVPSYPVPTEVQKKPIVAKPTKQAKKGGLVGNEPSQQLNCGGKAIKAKSLPSTANLLSLLPDAEGIGLHGKISAAGSALISQIGSCMPSRSNGKSASNHQRVRHPFPLSKGARSIAFGITGQAQHRKVVGSFQEPYHESSGSSANLDSQSLALPPILTPRERRRRNPVRAKDEKNFNKHAIAAIESVLEHFSTKDNSDKNVVRAENKSEKIGEESENIPVEMTITKAKVAVNRHRARNLKRHITEISLFKNIRGRQLKIDSNASSPQLKPTNTRPTQAHPEGGFDQLLALSVLHSLGLVTEISPRAGKDRHDCGKFSREIDASSELLDKSDIVGMSSALTDKSLSKLLFRNEERSIPINTVDAEGLHNLDTTHAESFNTCVLNNKDMHDNPANEQNDCRTSKTDNLVTQPHTSIYIPNLRGGGQSDLNSSSKKMKKRTDMQNHMSDISMAHSNCRPESPLNSSAMSSLLSNGVSPFVGTANSASHALSMSRSSSAAQSPSHTSRLAQHQQMRASRHNNELLQAMWGDQSRADLALLQSQGTSPIIPHRVASSLDSAYALIAQGGVGAESLQPSLYSTQANQSQNNGVAAAMSANARIQGQQQHSLSRPLGGAHEQYHQHSNSSHQLRFVQNSLQNATAALNSNPILHHSSAEMDYLQAAAYGTGHSPEWGALGVHSLLPSHATLNPSAIGLTPHQAAMVGLTARERLILTSAEHMQQLAHHNAAVMANGTVGLSSLPTQQGGFIDSQTRRPASAGQISRAVAAAGIHSGKIARALPKAPVRVRQQQAKHVATASSKSTRRIGQSSILENDGLTRKRPASASASDWPALRLVPSIVAPERPASADSRLLSLPAYRRKILSPSKQSKTLEGKIITAPLQQIKSVRNCSNSNRDTNSGNLVRSNSTPSKISGKPCVENIITSPDTKNKSVSKELDSLNDSEVFPVTPVQRKKRPVQNLVGCSIVSENMIDIDNKISVSENIDTCETECTEPVAPFTSTTNGLRFYVPRRPEKISSEEADLIRRGFFHQVVIVDSDEIMLNEGNKNNILLEYLMAVGAAVPIPKTLVAIPLKETLNSQSCRSIMVISAVINTWLWANHQKAFEKAFEKSGRIDVDPLCKWLIQATIESSLRVLSMQGSNFKSSVALGKIRYPTSNGNLISSQPAAPAAGTASLISQNLMRSFCVDEKMDNVIPNFNSLVSYLDEKRMSALRARSQERVLLAALVSRRTRMSEPFSHAYTSSMIRAGEALGYENLCDIVQDETTMTSTLLPFDILSDYTGAWEDPCRPQRGFIAGQSADELSKRAHSRAIIQKSLKKLQDRHGIKGGTPNAGSYIDSRQSESDASKSGSFIGTDNAILPPAKSSPPVRMKRKSSFSGPTDISGLPHGLNSAAATALFNPNHYSSPFVWDTGDTQNLPYGRHEHNEQRIQSSSQLRLSLLHGNIKLKKPRLDSSLTRSVTNTVDIFKSTHEIKWADVANMFQPATLGSVYERSLSNSKLSAQSHTTLNSGGASAIFAPFCRERDTLIPEESDDESDLDEDLSDEKMLESHQRVLDAMKDNFDVMMDDSKECQDKSRQRSNNSR